MDKQQSAPSTERRKHERSDCKGRIKWSYFNHSNFFEGDLLNFNQNGSYFETSKAIKIGSTIFVQFTDYFLENLSSDEKEVLRNVSLGEVEHCSEILKDDSTYYGVGIKYIFRY